MIGGKSSFDDGEGNYIHKFAIFHLNTLKWDVHDFSSDIKICKAKCVVIENEVLILGGT